MAANVKASKRERRNHSGSDRRKHPRLKPCSVPFLRSVVFNQGCEARVIDISRGGILVETEIRLRPQMKILLKLVTSEGTVKMGGHILRSSISSLDGIPLYKSAIAFDSPFKMLDDLSAELERQTNESSKESAAPPDIDPFACQSPFEFIPESPLEEEPATLTVIAQDGMSMRDMLEGNKW